jgi:outer membrane immunogenic protein
LAIARLEVTNSFRDFNGALFGVGASRSASTNTGWAVGGGAEWKLTGNWTVKGEYLFVDLGHVSTSATIIPPAAPRFSSGLTTRADLVAHIARVGLNYLF